MADPRLQWRQLNVSSPNVSGLMAGANDAWNSAFDTAGSVLKRYQDGQFETGDREANRRLTGIGTEADLNKFLAEGGLADLNISPEMQEKLYGHRDNVLGFENNRSVTADRDGRLGIAKDINRRAGADWAWDDGRRRELAGLKDEVVAARLEGQNYGSAGAPQGGVVDAVYQGLLARGMPEHIAQGFMMNFQDESGFQVDINEANPIVPGSRGGRGLYQLTGPRRKAFEAKYGEDGYTIDNQLDFLMEELNTTEAGAWEAIRNSQNAAEAGSNIVNRFLRPSPEYARQRSAKYIGANGFDVGAASAAVGRGTPARDVLTEAVANSQYLSLEDVTQILNGNDANVAQGDKKIGDELKQTQQDILAAVLSQTVANPEIISNVEAAKEVERLLGESGEFTAAEALQARRDAEALIAESDSLQTQLTPPVAEDIGLTEGINNTLADERRVFEGQDQNRALGDIERYTEDPTQNLMNDLGLGSDGENPGGLGGLLGFEKGFDENKLRNLVNEYANKFGVEPEVVAVAMRDSFNRDPWGRNTLRKRFDEEMVREKVQQLTPNDRRDYDRGRSNITIMENQMRQVESQINSARTQLAKMGPNDPRRAAIEANLVALDAQLAAIHQANTNRTP